MKEYKSIKVEVSELSGVANHEAQDDWRVLTILPLRYLPALGTSGLELTEVTVVFERGA